MNNTTRWMSRLAALIIPFALSGCMTIAYTPAVYKLGPERIQPLKVKGTVQYVNHQPSKETRSIEDSSHTFNFNYHSITDGFNNQLKNEIASRATFLGAQPVKTIGSKVKHIHCDKKFGSYVRNCVISVEVVTGAGEAVNIEAKQGASIFNDIPGSFNGTIATGVIDALNHKTIRAYLEQ